MACEITFGNTHYNQSYYHYNQNYSYGNASNYSNDYQDKGSDLRLFSMF